MSTIEVGKISITIKEVFDGVDISHKYYNAGEKEIKYITFSYLAYNAVNDIVGNNVNGKTEVSVRLTGPISPKKTDKVEWENVWFNPTVSTVVISKIHIQYMDDTEELIEGKDIISIHDQESAYYDEVTIPAQKEKRINDARHKLGRYYAKATAYDILSTVVSEFKDDEEGLFEVFKGLNPNCSMGYILGDYIEENYSSNKELMNKAIVLWKHMIDYQQKCYNAPALKEYKGYPKKYAAKIRKYEPTYVMPKKAGCLSK